MVSAKTSTKKPVAKPQAKPASPATAPTPVPVAEPAPSAVPDAPATTPVVGETPAIHAALNLIEILVTKQKELLDLAKAVSPVITSLKKEVTVLVKEHNKRVAKKASASNNNKAAAGFSKKSKVSDELYGFLNFAGVKKDELVARNDVKKHIHDYIVKNKLQVKGDGRWFTVDASLKKLFAPTEDIMVKNAKNVEKAKEDWVRYSKDGTLSYFNYQKFLSPHFIQA